MMTNSYMTPKQWSTLRALIQNVREVASRRLNVDLMVQAEMFLIKTEEYDV